MHPIVTFILQAAGFYLILLLTKLYTTFIYYLPTGLKSSGLGNAKIYKPVSIHVMTPTVHPPAQTTPNIVDDNTFYESRGLRKTVIIIIAVFRLFLLSLLVLGRGILKFPKINGDTQKKKKGGDQHLIYFTAIILCDISLIKETNRVSSCKCGADTVTVQRLLHDIYTKYDKVFYL